MTNKKIDGNIRAILRCRAQDDGNMRSYPEGSGTIKYINTISQNDGFVKPWSPRAI